MFNIFCENALKKWDYFTQNTGYIWAGFFLHFRSNITLINYFAIFFIVHQSEPILNSNSKRKSLQMVRFDFLNLFTFTEICLHFAICLHR